jgi:hypothetical protein
MDFINNPWVIGIGGGILSGILVALVSRYLFQKRDNKEYMQKVASVNREVLYALRPGISEGMIPSVKIITSLITSTARRYGVDEKDTYNPSAIADELIKEVMDSSFISSKSKNEFCESIVSIKQEVERPVAAKGPSVSEAVADYRRRMVITISVMLGVVTTLMTFAFVTWTEIKDQLTGYLGLMLAPVIAAMAGFIAVVAVRTGQERQSENSKKDKDKKRAN